MFEKIYLSVNLHIRGGEMRYRNQKGFTLIEVIVVAGIIAILAGILVPMIFSQVDEARITRAHADCSSIAKAIQTFRAHTGKWPSFSAGTAPCVVGNATLIDVLMSGGNTPALDAGVTGWTLGGSGTAYLSWFLRSDVPGSAASGNPGNNCYPVPSSPDGVGWKGPYLSATNEDPWGNAYVINAPDFENNNKVYVLSAGPNGIIETTTTGGLSGDDIGISIK